MIWTSWKRNRNRGKSQAHLVDFLADPKTKCGVLTPFEDFALGLSSDEPRCAQCLKLQE